MSHYNHGYIYQATPKQHLKVTLRLIYKKSVAYKKKRVYCRML